MFQRFGPRPSLRTGVVGGPSDGAWSMPYQFIDPSKERPGAEQCTDLSLTAGFKVPELSQPIPENLIVTVEDCTRLGDESRIIAISSEMYKDLNRVVVLFVVPQNIDPTGIDAKKSKLKQRKKAPSYYNLVNKDGEKLGETERRFVLGADIDELESYFDSLKT